MEESVGNTGHILASIGERRRRLGLAGWLANKHFVRGLELADKRGVFWYALPDFILARVLCLRSHLGLVAGGALFL